MTATLSLLVHPTTGAKRIPKWVYSRQNSQPSRLLGTHGPFGHYQRFNVELHLLGANDSLNLRLTDKWEAINQMIEVLIEEQQFPSTQRQRVLQSALERERKSSTGLGPATAIPHAPIPDLPGIIGCLGICPEGVDFDSNTGEKVHFIFLLLTPQQNYRSYIPVLAQIASLVRNDSMQQALLSAQTPAEVTAKSSI